MRWTTAAIALIALIALTVRCSVYGTETSVPFICAPEVHAQGITGKGVTVAVIDTGVDYDALYGHVRGGVSIINGVRDYSDGGANPDPNGHGTLVSLIIAHPTGVARRFGFFSLIV